MSADNLLLALSVLGFACLVAGAWILALPAGLITAGALLLSAVAYADRSEA